MIEEILMGIGALVATVGAFIWTAGELHAVKKGEDTTTSYVRRGIRRNRVLRALVALGTTAFVLFADWLWIHFNLGVL